MTGPTAKRDDRAGSDDIAPFGAHSIPSLLTVLIVGLLGWLVGPVLMVVVFDVFRGHKLEGRLWQWVFILGIETSFWALAVVPISASVRRLWRYTGVQNADVRKLIGFVLLLGVLTAVPLALAKQLGFFEPLNRQFAPLLILVGVGSIVAAPGVIGIWLVDRAVAAKMDAAGGIAQIANYLRLKRSLDAYRSFLGIMLGLVVLAAGAQRSAIVAASSATDFRPVFVLLFGLYNTLLLILVYLPTYLRLVATGREIVDKIQPLPDDVDALDAALSRRRTLVDLFDLERSATDKLRSALFLLTPVFSSIVVTVIGLSSN